jgi:hypothetical protein
MDNPSVGLQEADVPSESIQMLCVSDDPEVLKGKINPNDN